jgi:hypothetical protein
MHNRSVVCFLAILLCLSFSDRARCQQDLRVWREFVDILKSGKMTADRIRPLAQLGDSYKPTLLGFLDSVRAQASSADWDAQPEVIRIEDRLQFIVPWSARNQKITYCFSFVTDSTHWYFQHLEAIFIRLDKIGDLPTSSFPDVSEEMKAWAREEIYWSFVILNVYLPLVKERGKEVALNTLKDGAGYFVGARTWVPFCAPNKAFVLYLCWEQAHLRGNQFTLLKLEDDHATVQMNTHYFALFFTAAHLRPVISLADFTSIFETIWRDRASKAGWHLDIEYAADHQVTFHLTRSP